MNRSVEVPEALDRKLAAKAAEVGRPVEWVILRCLEVELLGRSAAMGAAVLRGSSRRALEPGEAANLAGRPVER